ncbi:MAG: hypothetical protein KA436_08310 [Oligoflexales bacterium]|nr:hypothetical protein [Oligoflexales bacterium]
MLEFLFKNLRTQILLIFLLSCHFPLALAFTKDNRILRENQKPASPYWVLQNPALQREIEGYAGLTSIEKGQSLDVFVNTKAENFTWELFRLGWYGGGGARLVEGPKIERGQKQKVCPIQEERGALIECDWQKSFTIHTADYTDLVSGFYLIRLTEIATRKDSVVLFVLREDELTSDFVFTHSVTTDLAYSPWGGRWLYYKATQTSFNRPMLPPNFAPNTLAVGTGYFFSYYDYNLVRWMEKKGYDVKYITNLDVHEDEARFLNARIFLSVGHDEYWSSEMRKNLLRFRDAGKSIVFFSSNVMYWQVRFEPDAQGHPNRRMICYRKAELDPELQAAKKTTRFRDPALSDPEASLIGVQMDGDFPFMETDITIRDASHWLFHGTGLRDGDKLRGMLGFEVDRMWWNSPISTKRLAASKYLGQKGGPSFSDMTLYKSQSGALVFSSGSMQWIWGLDDTNIFGPKRGFENPAVEKISQNIFAEILEPRYELEPYPSEPVLLDLHFQDPIGSTHFKDDSAYQRSVLCLPAHCPQLVFAYRTKFLHFDKKKSFLDLGIEPSIRGRIGFRVEMELRIDPSDEKFVVLQQRDDRGTVTFNGFEGSYQITVEPDGKLNFWTWSRKDGFALELISKTSLKDGQWHKVIFSRKKDGSGEILIDGKKDAEQSTNKITDLKPHTLFLGHDPMAKHLRFGGDIAHLKITEQPLDH